MWRNTWEVNVMLTGKSMAVNWLEVFSEAGHQIPATHHDMVWWFLWCEGTFSSQLFQSRWTWKSQLWKASSKIKCLEIYHKPENNVEFHCWPKVLHKLDLAVFWTEFKWETSLMLCLPYPQHSVEYTCITWHLPRRGMYWRRPERLQPSGRVNFCYWTRWLTMGKLKKEDLLRRWQRL